MTLQLNSRYLKLAEESVADLVAGKHPFFEGLPVIGEKSIRLNEREIVSVLGHLDCSSLSEFEVYRFKDTLTKGVQSKIHDEGTPANKRNLSLAVEELQKLSFHEIGSRRGRRYSPNLEPREFELI